jgi:hypothetical protein
MTLLEIQRRVAGVVMQPLTQRETMRAQSRKEAEALIRPNDRLTSFERLEIYNRQYWFRILDSFAEDFPGLGSVVGKRRFDAIARTYLTDCPSESFTLRNLGSRLELWLRANPKFIAGCEELALDMARLEWAHIEVFDELALPPLTLADLDDNEEIAFSLQPYLRFLAFTYPVDEMLLRLGAGEKIRRQALRPETVHLAVHRLDNSVYYKRLAPEEHALLSAVAAGIAFDAAIEAAFSESTLSEQERIQTVQAAFANWAELGWFCRPHGIR